MSTPMRRRSTNLGSLTLRPLYARGVRLVRTSAFSAKRARRGSAMPTLGLRGRGWLRSRIATTRRTSSGSIRISRPPPTLGRSRIKRQVSADWELGYGQPVYIPVVGWVGEVNVACHEAYSPRHHARL